MIELSETEVLYFGGIKLDGTRNFKTYIYNDLIETFTPKSNHKNVKVDSAGARMTLKDGSDVVFVVGYEGSGVQNVELYYIKDDKWVVKPEFNMPFTYYGSWPHVLDDRLIYLKSDHIFLILNHVYIKVCDMQKRIPILFKLKFNVDHIRTILYSNFGLDIRFRFGKNPFTFVSDFYCLEVEKLWT